VGLQPESAYRLAIQRHQTRPVDQLLAQARAAWQAGKRQPAIARLREALDLEPDDAALKATLADWLLTGNDLEAARELLATLPLEERTAAPASGLLARLEFAGLAHDAPDTAALRQRLTADPNDCGARQQLAARAVVSGDYEAALEQFLEILRRRPQFADGAERRGMLAVFAILGDDHPLTGVWRRRLAASLY
ncbi:MAG: tetratricopeptide repeat protein, partial [Pseudomonadota bacterium]|nr:tetratricopeptide repeat protein [Pseudomonadota bacterium]